MRKSLMLSSTQTRRVFQIYALTRACHGGKREDGYFVTFDESSFDESWC